MVNLTAVSYSKVLCKHASGHQRSKIRDKIEGNGNAMKKEKVNPPNRLGMGI